MLIFCTLFNSAYLSRGLALYESLKVHCNDFHLYIFAFDDATYHFFNDFQISNITPISMKDFEDEELLSVKTTRTKGEYCWTCTSSTIQYVLTHFDVEHCIYIDADLYFFSSPQVLVDEMENASILITEHRYTKEYDQTTTSGKYCVQFMMFKNDDRGRTALRWWRSKCLDWCYNRIEDGKFGDQKYLDDWTERFEGVHVLKNLGGGVAPWNMQQYTFNEENGIICGHEIVSGKNFNLVFFHFHAIQFISSNYFSPYSIYNMPCRKMFLDIFVPYVFAIKKIRCEYNLVKKYESYYGLKQIFFHVMRTIYHNRVLQELFYLRCTHVSLRLNRHFL